MSLDPPLIYDQSHLDDLLTLLLLWMIVDEDRFDATNLQPHLSSVLNSRLRNATWDKSDKEKNRALSRSIAENIKAKMLEIEPRGRQHPETAVAIVWQANKTATAMCDAKQASSTLFKCNSLRILAREEGECDRILHAQAVFCRWQ